MSKNKKCECCKEIIVELVAFHQSFKNLCHNLNQQIAELKREIRQNNNNSNRDNKRNATLPVQRNNNKLKKCSTRRHSDDYDDNDDDDTSPRRASKRLKLKHDVALFVQALDEPLVKIEDVVEGDVAGNVSQSSESDFMDIQSRAMPTRPFARAQEFTDWDFVLANDEDQRDLLRIELLQDHYDEPDKYIKSIWRRLLTPAAAKHLSLRSQLTGKGKTIKSYQFFEIFKECFLQRYEKLKDHDFTAASMSYFSYSKNLF